MNFMELVEVVARAVGFVAEVATEGLSGGNKKPGKIFYIIAIILVIAIFLFTLIMSQ